MPDQMESPQSSGSSTGLTESRRSVRGELAMPGGGLGTYLESPYDRAAKPHDETPPISMAALRACLRRRWPAALGLGVLLGPPLAAAAWYLLPPKYVATAFLQIDAVDAPLIFRTADREEGGTSPFDLYKNTQSQLIKTPFVLNKALSDPKVKELAIVKQAPDPYQWLANELQVEYPNRGELMSISMVCPQASESVAIVDAVVDAYMNEAVLAERNERLQRVDNLERVYADAEGKVRARRSDIRNLADTLGTGDSESLSVAQQMAIERYGSAQSDLGKINFELMREQGELQAQKQLLAQIEESLKLAGGAAAADQAPGIDNDVTADQEVTVTDYEIDRLVDRDSTYQRLFADARKLQDEIETLSERYGEGFIRPQREKLERVRRELNERREQLKKSFAEEKRLQLANAGSGAVANLDPNASAANQELFLRRKRIAETQETVQAKEIRIGILQQQKQIIQEELAVLDAEAKKLGKSSVDLEMMRSEISSLDEVLVRLSGEIERTKIELKSGSRVSVVSKATPSGGSSDKKRYAATGALGLAGLCFPMLLFAFADLRKKYVDDADAVSNELGVSVLGTVPYERGLTNEGLVEGEYGNSISSIVAMLVRNARFDGSKVVMVTSAIPGEGKSTIAESLWRGLSNAKYRTLLVDMDLRRPSLAKRLHRPDQVGVSDVLSDTVGWEHAVQKIGDNRFFICAGKSTRLNLAGVANQQMPAMFNALRNAFDFIIVDTAPILPVVDTRIIGEVVDSAVLAVMRDRSRLPQLVAARELLRAHGTPLIGLVINGLSPGKHRYGYGYSYDYDHEES